ncbi:MAG: CmlA/FloR family chloramphenicol efflux MFS transporter [Steroidobacteraceae bacterium]|nr:CmlA/FloR family chloramphenicol efflux MFS transporter [Steroidobacteraceae bacterium]
MLVPFNLLAALGMDLYLPVVPGMAEVLRVEASTIQLTLTLYLVILGAGQLVFGPLSDRYGRRPVLVAGALSFSIASFGLAMVTSPGWFFVWRVIQACGAAACMVAVFATVRDLYGGKPEGSAVYGTLGAMLAVMPAAGPVLGAFLDAWQGWRSIFIALGAGMTVMLFVALSAWRETCSLGDSRARRTALLEPLRSRRFWWYVVGYGAGMGAFFVCFSTSPWLIMERMRLSQIVFSMLFATIAVTMMIASRIIGNVAPRWGMRRSLQRGMACLLVAGVLLALGERLAPDALLSALVPMWISGFGIAIANAVAPNGALRDFDHAAGTATAWFFCIGGAFSGITGTAAAALFPVDTRWPMAAYCLTLPLFVLALSRKTTLPAANHL